MELSQDYWIKGNSYDLREEIKSWGGFYVAAKKLWRINSTNRKDVPHMALTNLGLQLVPINLSPECKKIQDILNKV